MRVARSAEHLEHGTPLTDRAAYQDEHLVGDVAKHSEVVADEDECEARALAQVTKQLEHRRLRRNVKRRGELIAEKDARPGNQRPCDRDTLALPCAELARAPLEEAWGELDALECLGGRAAPSRGRQRGTKELERPAEHGRDALARVERRVRVLEDDLDRAQLLTSAMGDARVKHLAREADSTGARPLQPGDRSQERRLAGAALARDTEHTSRAQGKRDTVEREL